jgi:hypothetical protein
MDVNIVTCRGYCVTNKTGSGLDIDTLCTVLGTTGNYSTIADLHTLQLTVTHALGFSVFTSRILATDLWQSHCNFNSHMKSPFHSLIPLFLFLLYRLRLPSPVLDPILDKKALKRSYLSRYNHSKRTMKTTQPFCCREGSFTDPLLDALLLRAYAPEEIFTDPLPSNGAIRHNMYFWNVLKLKKYLRQWL